MHFTTRAFKYLIGIYILSLIIFRKVKRSTIWQECTDELFNLQNMFVDPIIIGGLVVIAAELIREKLTSYPEVNKGF